MDSFYKTLDEESQKLAFRNDYDFDSPSAIDFDILVERLQDLKAGYATSSTPTYSTSGAQEPEIFKINICLWRALGNLVA